MCNICIYIIREYICIYIYILIRTRRQVLITPRFTLLRAIRTNMAAWKFEAWIETWIGTWNTDWNLEPGAWSLVLGARIVTWIWNLDLDL